MQLALEQHHHVAGVLEALDGVEQGTMRPLEAESIAMMASMAARPLLSSAFRPRSLSSAVSSSKKLNGS